MKNRIQGIIAGFVSALLLVSTVYAATTHREFKTLNYTDLQVVVDGETIDLTDANGNIVEPFSVDGVTYLPLRVMANAIGKQFANWDQQANIAYFGKTPGLVQYLPDVCPAYQKSNNDIKEYSVLRGGQDSFEMAGIKYFNGIAFRSNECYALYNLNGEWNNIKAKIGCLDEDDRNPATLYVYGDGILLKSYELTSDMYPYDISFSVANVSQLKIEKVGYWGDYALANVTIE
jgi:hypothetical protein